jgi:AcrR family transcriptional regulator
MPSGSFGSRARDPDPRFLKLRPGAGGRDGLTSAQVREHQLTRIYEATIEVAASRGYPRTSIKAVCALAGVSRQTFYELFAGGPRHPREACFLCAYEHALERALAAVELACRGGREDRRRLRSAVERFARHAREDPRAARFLLVAPFEAGPAALERMQHARRRFQRLLCPGAGDHGVSPAVAKGIVGGVERVTRNRLIAGRIHDLASEASELSAWASSYRRFSSPARRKPPAVPARPSQRLGASDERLRILRATAAIAGRDGYPGLSAARIVKLAGVSDATFAELFDCPDPVQACFLATLDLLGLEALLQAASGARDTGGWPERLRRGITSLLAHVARHPVLVRVAFVEVFAAGPAAVERRSRLLHRFTRLFLAGVPAPRRPSPTVAEATVGAIWAIVHDHVLRGQADRLPELADDAAYLALAPLLGHEPAAAIIAATPAAETPDFARSREPSQTSPPTGL